ncbi:putative glycoside hydrolase family 16 protein [Phaeoacremonium minimum UCRPA7]|uniref:endo-1,3(4)-beta-glucanase n=1 Tax=Phaeoacremonium minimum (strain UCR-PA7) TaxID=1286976 RepID=R8BRX7_PHAM7|nr:putative glycoside hydrolase family 16 protein [Phaeoacremonium minimum UCRPA7]EOO02045.1 putative glycoside hydrolase family 16 protein [Phaeoacremonium minimum UCRPA7]
MLFSTSIFRIGTLLVTASVANAAYTLQDDYSAGNFFQEFDFYDGADPTNGFVQYQSAVEANAAGLAGFVGSSVYLGVDYRTNNPSAGRPSVRVTSKKAYTKGLFIADIAHMPVGCGVWPAMWMFGPNWPSSGEIDIIEGVNSQSTNAITLHTSAGCSISNTGSLASTKLTTTDGNCNSGNGNIGCGQSTSDTNNYGAGLNSIGGGVYAVEWTSTGISVWFFPRGSAQASALSGNSTAGAGVDTSAFGQPLATFVGGSGCNIDEHFMNHNLVFNTDFCGDWAGQVWSQDATCSSLAATCNDYVANNPRAFVEAYWLINSVKVYQDAGLPAKRDRVMRSFIA